jgi:hypothetical protein
LTNASMYDNDREKITYALSQMKEFIFEIMHDWMIEKKNKIIMKSFFKKIENYMKLHRFEKIIKKKLLIIFIKNIESINEFYHRIFKLWTKIKIFDENKMNQFWIAIKYVFVNALLNKQYTDMKAMFEIIKKIKN